MNKVLHWTIEAAASIVQCRTLFIHNDVKIMPHQENIIGHLDSNVGYDDIA